MSEQKPTTQAPQTTQNAEVQVPHLSEFAKLMSGPVSLKARAIDDFAGQAVRFLDDAGQTLLAAMARGKAASMLRERISDPSVWPSILALKGMVSGFATDERPAKGRSDAVTYSDRELQEAIVDALLDGAMLSDCEINIISGRKYLGVSFYRRKLREVASDIIWAPGIPTVITTTKPGYNAGEKDDLSMWRVPALLKFTPSRDGKTGSPVVFDHSGASPETPCVAVQYRGYKDTIDAAIGKAERKLRKRAYEMCVGRFTEDDGEIPESTDAADTKSSAAEELRAKFAAAKQPDNTPTAAAKDRPQPSTAETGMNAVVASPGSTSPVRPDSEAAPGTEAEEDAPNTDTQEAPVKDVAGQLPIFADAPLPDVPKRERKKAAAPTPTAPTTPQPAATPTTPAADADSPLSEGMYTGPVDPSVFPQGPKDDTQTKPRQFRSAEPEAGDSGVNKLDASAEPARKTFQQFCDECSTLADNVCVSTGFIPERMSTQLTAAMRSIASAKGFTDDDSTRETILTAIEEQRGKFAFLAPPAQKPQTHPQAETAPAETTAAPAVSEPLPPDWQTFAAAYSGLSSVAGNAPDVTEAGLKKIALRKGWLGAKSAEASTPAGQKFMGEILAAVRAGKWDWATAKPAK